MKMLWAVGQRFLASSLAIAPVRAQKFRIRAFTDRGGQDRQCRPHCLCVDQGGLSGRIRLNTPYSSRLAVQRLGLTRGPRRTPKAYRIFSAQLRGPSRRSTLLPQITIGANVKNLVALIYGGLSLPYFYKICQDHASTRIKVPERGQSAA